MTVAAPLESMSLAEIRAEMEILMARAEHRGGFHPAEYWRLKDLARMEESILGINPPQWH